MTVAQVPTLPGTSHASHWPPHARSQQKPSTQLPEAHCAATAQAAPCGNFGRHTPAEQKLPAAQSPSTPHPAEQVSPAHGCTPQDWACSGQRPAPSHEAASRATPSAHEAERQLTDAPG